MLSKETLAGIAADLRAGRAVELSSAVFPCFSAEALKGNAHVSPDDLGKLSAALTAADAPTFERAACAMAEGDLAWLGFKVVFDPAAAQANTDNEVTKKYGDTGSADGAGMVFFCNDAKEIVSARTPSPRDVFQMKDITRGPGMHNEQFDGLTWLSVPLFDQVRVWLLGFAVTAVDYDPAYLSPERFPDAERVLLDGGNFDELDKLTPAPGDYVCVLTRGHMFDPEGCVWAVKHNVHYVGMMGCKGKNSTVHDLVLARGVSEADWERIKRPIGLKFGAKTPAELAISIVAELVDVRYTQRYSPEARARHEESLGR